MQKFTFKNDLLKFMLLMITAFTTGNLFAQSAPPQAGGPLNQAGCPANGAVLSASSCLPGDFSARFVSGAHVGNTGGANGLSQGAVWRFANITNVADPLQQTNAQITVEVIYQAVLTELDDDAAVNENSQNTSETQNWFAPRIDVDQNLAGTNRRGYIQFRIDFFKENPLNSNDYVDPKDLIGINYSQRDIDGQRTGSSSVGYYFRETGHVQKPTGAITINASASTELTANNYTGDGSDWYGFAGSICSKDGVARYANVAASFVYAAPQSTIRVRLGYDYQKLASGDGYGNQVARLFASEFKCFTFPDPGQLTLPVKYGFFNAKREGNDVKLTWQTATESKNYGFEIERRIANGEWQKIGLSLAKSAHGNSSTPINYDFTDANNTAKGVIQYRLKQLDYDMHSAYSDIRAIRGSGLSAGLLIYPNPSTDGKVNIVFEDNKSAVDVSLSDMNGRTIKQWRKVTSSALQINNLTPGMYTLRIINSQSGEQVVEKIMVNNR